MQRPSWEVFFSRGFFILKVKFYDKIIIKIWNIFNLFSSKTMLTVQWLKFKQNVEEIWNVIHRNKLNKDSYEMLDNAKKRILSAVDNKELDQNLVNSLEIALKWIKAFLKEAQSKDFKDIKEYKKLLIETESFLDKEAKSIKVKVMKKKS